MRGLTRADGPGLDFVAKGHMTSDGRKDRSIIGAVRLTALVACLLAAGCGQPASGRRLVIAVPSGPLSLLPHSTNEEFAAMVYSNIYESLADFDAKLGLVPQLAETWYTEDDRTWLFRLRAGSRFHDGKLLEASDVVASLERIRTDSASTRRGELSIIESLAARDAQTVVVRTRRPFGGLPHRIANAAVWRSASSPGLPPLGTGPYRVLSWRAAGDTVITAFDGHPSGPPPIREVEFRVVSKADERVRLLREGSVHLVMDPPPGVLRSLSGAASVRVVGEMGLRVIFLGLQHARPPLDDRRLRQAVALAVDREALVLGPLEGRAELIDQIVAPAVFGYDHTLPAHAHDPAAARRLVEATHHPAHHAIELEYMPSKYQAMPAVAERIAADLKAAGMSVVLQPRETIELFARVERHEPTMFLMGWTCSGGDAAVTYNYLLRTPAEGYGSYNGGSYSNPELDDLLERAGSLLQHPQRDTLLARVARVVHHDVAVVPLYRQADLYLTHQDLVLMPRLDRRIQCASLRWRTDR